MKIKNSVLVLLLFLNSNAVLAQQTVAGSDTLSANLRQAIANPPKATPAEELIKKISNITDPYQRCEAIKDVALGECASPSSSTFKTAANLLLTVPSIATSFLSGGDNAGRMAEMCQMTALAGVVGGLLNGTQGSGCDNAMNSCNSVCSASIKSYNDQATQLRSAGQNAQAEEYMRMVDRIKTTEQECINKATAQKQLAQQQQQANAQPIAGMQACSEALAGEEESSLVDCSQDYYRNDPSCATVGKVGDNGLGSTYEPGVAIDTTADDVDMPTPENREDFWNNLKNKTSGNQGSGGGRAGAGAGMSGGPGGQGGNKAGAGGARRSSNASFSGGSESSGGGAGGWGNSSGLSGRLAKLAEKKKGLNMLTQKKLAGRGLAAAELGVASDDIWTRVYLRTNTRCAKQLVECAANKSQNPYGAFK